MAAGLGCLAGCGDTDIIRDKPRDEDVVGGELTRPVVV